MSLPARAVLGVVLSLFLTACSMGTPDQVPAAAPSRPTAHELVARAVKASASDGRPVLLVVHDDGRSSAALATLLAQPRVAGALTDFHVVQVPLGSKAGAREAAARGVDLARSKVPALAVLVDGQAVYAGEDRHFAHPARLTDRQVVRWLRRWS